MSEMSENINSTSKNLLPDSSSSIGDIITINTTTQLPLKLTPTNFSSWKTQVETLMLGLDLDGYLDGSFPCPPKTITHEKQIVSNPDYRKWLRQDALIRHAILSSSTFAIQPSLDGLTTVSRLGKN
ncbi:hypothetical protein Patl1_26525 [Pistacia atlantica]|uniref:Uncharacterized protein n=1 Tax=Pistacia atlantica TaxID=434234 RepID=A0ACC1B3R9_9ROSI|nr:hypothetical protein Patl1_26525 [Pistacia atlantica]